MLISALSFAINESRVFSWAIVFYFFHNLSIIKALAQKIQPYLLTIANSFRLARPFGWTRYASADALQVDCKLFIRHSADFVRLISNDKMMAQPLFIDVWVIYDFLAPIIRNPVLVN